MGGRTGDGEGSVLMTAPPAYGKAFFSDQQVETQDSASEIVPFLMQWLAPRSVIDIGCGVGDWLAELQKQGVERILGVDGEYVNRDWLRIPRESFVPHDLTQPFATTDRFDLAICLEVAEHLPESVAQSLIKCLTTLSPVVLFSAAVPFQGGVGHVNEQWQDYWAARFVDEGYVPVDVLRPQIWDNEHVRWWYAQNAIVYVRRQCLPTYPILEAEMSACRGRPLRIVHPKMYLGLHFNTNPQNMKVAHGLRVACEALRHFGRRRIARFRKILRPQVVAEQTR